MDRYLLLSVNAVGSLNITGYITVCKAQTVVDEAKNLFLQRGLDPRRQKFEQPTIQKFKIKMPRGLP